MEFFLQESEFKLEHRLNPLFNKIKSYKTRRQYEKSQIYKDYGEEIRRVESGLEWRNDITAADDRKFVRVVAWNVERGRNLTGILQFLKTDERLLRADIFLLTETDIGMGRSGNYNIPREIAAAMGMNYCFANSFIVLSKGDEGEQDHNLENTLSLHGTAILSKFPIVSCQNPLLYPVRDHFPRFEKRLGQRRGLICKIRINDQLYDFSAAHLDLKSSPRQRARQVQSILAAMSRSRATAQLFGGDLNTHTYNLRNNFCAILSLAYKILFLGTAATISHYLSPEKIFEKPVFDMFKRYGFAFKPYNDCSKGTLLYDIEETTFKLKTQSYFPERFFNGLKNKLKPWRDGIPLRLDWFAGKGFEVVSEPAGSYGPPRTIEPAYREGKRISDHNPIIVDLKLNN